MDGTMTEPKVTVFRRILRAIGWLAVILILIGLVAYLGFGICIFLAAHPIWIAIIIVAIILYCAIRAIYRILKSRDDMKKLYEEKGKEE